LITSLFQHAGVTVFFDMAGISHIVVVLAAQLKNLFVQFRTIGLHIGFQPLQIRLVLLIGGHFGLAQILMAGQDLVQNRPIIQGFDPRHQIEPFFQKRLVLRLVVLIAADKGDAGFFRLGQSIIVKQVLQLHRSAAGQCQAGIQLGSALFCYTEQLCCRRSLSGLRQRLVLEHGAKGFFVRAFYCTFIFFLQIIPKRTVNRTKVLRLP